MTYFEVEYQKNSAS